MKKSQKYGRLAKKTVIACAVVFGILLLFVILTRWKQGQPQNPMDQEADASRMYRTTSILAMDKSLLEGIENANISSGGEETTEEKGKEEEKKEEKEQQEQEKQEEEWEEQQEQQEQSEQGQLQTEQQETDTNNQENIALDSNISGNSPVIHDSLMSLIQNHKPGMGENPESQNPGNGNNPGGNEPGGGDHDKPVTGGDDFILNPEESQELFTTSIVDGEQVSEPDYYFTVTLTEKGKAQKLISQTVTVNGNSKNFENGDRVKLKEGANSIIVTLRFRDKNYNQVDAPSKTYTVYYIPNNHYYLQVVELNRNVELSDGQELDLWEPQTHLQVTAKAGNGKENVVVRLNGKRLSNQEDGTYKGTLILGSNQLIVTVGSGVNQQKMTCNLKYSPEEFTLGFESEAITEEIRGEQFGGISYGTYSSESPAFDFRVRCSGGTGDETIHSVLVTTRFGSTQMGDRISGRDGSIHLQELDASEDTQIQVTCSNGKSYTWMISYERIGETPTAKRPVIEFNLADGEELDNTPYILTVHAKDYQQNSLYPEQMEILLNGIEIGYSGISGISYEYFLYLQEGENHLKVTVTDNEQYQAVKEITFYYSAEVKNVNVTLIVDAGVLGLQPFIAETLDVPSTNTIAEFLEERLAAYGFVSTHDGTPTSGAYYLSAIAKPNMLRGWSLTEDQRLYYKEYGYEIDENPSLDSLGEFDFTRDSGWMITLNDYFIGMGMGTRPVRDGDVVHVQFTLNRGVDIGVDSDGGIYG